MTLRDWKPHTTSVHAHIRVVLQAQDAEDVSTAACKAWARAFIQARVPAWQPGTALLGAAAQLVGAEFEKAVAMAKGARKKKRGYRRRYRGDA